MKIISIIGARPNFMKIAPFLKAINKYNSLQNAKIKHVLIHTGQHYDDRMSNLFFKELKIPSADLNLNVGSGSHAEQVGQTMIRLEKILMKEDPDWVVVVGDVNATIAGSITTKKLGYKLCHIEAGLRSGDILMPEEINRLVTDRLSDLLLTPDQLSSRNLLDEGIPISKIKLVGNIMIDTLEANRERASNRIFNEIIKKNIIYEENYQDISNSKYALLTMHRPSNVDDKEILESIIEFIYEEVSKEMYIVWPIHPRTKKQLEKFKLYDKIKNFKNIILLHPLGYIDMLKLNMDSSIVITDSGGLQEECTILGTPCLTLRWNTERPVTLKDNGGVSVLVGNNIINLKKEFQNLLKANKKPVRPELWDGHTAKRCLKAILDYS